MANVAHYEVLHHGAFTLDAATPDRERTLYWRMPANFVFGTNRAKPMLAFMLVPLGGDARFQIYVNARRILSWGPISTRTVHGLWSPFSARVPFPEGSSFPDNVPIRIIASTGRMRFENVVMWSQVRV